MKVVRVRWVDNTTDAGWSPEKRVRPAHCQTVGWLVSDRHDSVTLAASRNNEGQWGDRTVILRPNITSMRTLR